MSSRRGRMTIKLLLVALLSGCGQEISPHQQQELASGTEAYNAGNYSQVIRHANAVLQETRSGQAAAQAWYLRGMARYEQDQLQAAREDLQQALDEAHEASLMVKAADALGEIAYRQDDLTAAAGYFQTVLERGEPTQPPADHAHYRLGSIYQRQSQWEQADLHFQRLIYHFPDSELAELASQRSGARHWTIQAGSFTERDNAMSASKLFPITGPRPFVEPVIRGTDRVYLLMVGKWTRYDQAAAALPAVRDVKPDAFLNVVR